MENLNQKNGYCYVVEFSNGRIKVGTTKYISTRLNTHRSSALSSGIVATRFAHTKQHTNYLENEKKLIEFLTKIGNVAHGREFFEDVDFECAVQCLRELECECLEKLTSTPVEIIDFKSSAISIKRYTHVYSDNPSVSEYKKTVTCSPKESGGVYEWEEVDNEPFVVLFLGGIKQAVGLSKAGLAMFELVYRQVQDNPGTDQIGLSYELARRLGLDISERVFRNGLRDLLEREFLYESLIPGVFFVNIRYMFNGDRIAFVKAYKRKGARANQEDFIDATPVVLPKQNGVATPGRAE